MAYENYSIKQFMSALFKADRSVMNEDEFNIVYTEYIDTAGLFESEEFEKVSYIYYINNRINSIKIAIRLQKEFLNNFDLPYIEGLSFFKKFGHTLYWTNPKDTRDHETRRSDFFKALDKIEAREKKYITILETSIKDLTTYRLKKNKKETTVQQSRAAFIRTLNTLGKIGYKIDTEKTSVEEYAYMIKQQTEDNKG